jgi:hypothetical protein
MRHAVKLGGITGPFTVDSELPNGIAGLDPSNDINTRFA